MTGSPSCGDQSSSAPPSPPTSNPFSTRFIRPGMQDYVFPPGESASSCVDRLAAARWRGQIVGPHGSGKSTLLWTLLPLIAERGRRVERFELRDRQRRLPEGANPIAWTSASLVIVDGYEQLSNWSRWQLHRWCRRVGAGLLVTVHQPLRHWPIILSTSTSPALLQQLTDRLVAAKDPARTPTSTQIEQAFAACGGNLREALLRLYDAWEASRDSKS